MAQLIGGIRAPSSPTFLLCLCYLIRHLPPPHPSPLHPLVPPIISLQLPPPPFNLV